MKKVMEKVCKLCEWMDDFHCHRHSPVRSTDEDTAGCAVWPRVQNAERCGDFHPKDDEGGQE